MLKRNYASNFGAGNQTFQNVPESGDGPLPGIAISVRHFRSQAPEQRRLQRTARSGQAKQLLPAIHLSRPALKQFPRCKIVQDTSKRLFRNRQQLEKIADRQVRLARDEIESAVVGAAKALGRKLFVNRARQVTIPEIQQLHSPPDLCLSQEMWRSGRTEHRSIWDSHIDVSCRVDYPIASHI